jgi:hypothetical protein
LDVPNIKNNDYSFMTDKYLTIQFDSETITISNPLVGGRIFKNGIDQKTTRNGYLNPKTLTQQNQMASAQTQFDNTLLITNYESISSADIPRKRNTIVNTIPLETPHNTIHSSLGGQGGSMSSITSASHDPIFWLHHCNVDRYFYNWMVRITNNFTIKLSPNEILPETLNLPLVPFFSSQVNLLINDDYMRYNFCWRNNTRSYLQISQVIDLSQYNYTYELIDIKQKLMWKPQYFELIGIPIPRESANIKLYIIPNDLNLLNLDYEQKEKYLAGMSCWNGINRVEIHCDRCEKTRTNISIDISDYLLSNGINKKNISKYNLILEADGLSIVNLDGSFNTYTHKQIISDGKYLLVLDSDDIISNREFKFEQKYIHTRFVQGIIYKFDKLGYHIDDITNWNEIENVVSKFEYDWNIRFDKLIKLRPTDKLISQTTTNTDIVINLLKDIFIEGLKMNKQVILHYNSEGFNQYYIDKISNCIEEWVRLFKLKSLDIKFIFNPDNKPDNKSDNKSDLLPQITFRFVKIDGDYGVCGNTYMNDNSNSDSNPNSIIINIDSEENYLNMSGLFELVVSHELGHAFGLAHNSNPESIMHPFISDLDKKVSLQDIENIFI